jgi:hypothetical protein
MVPLNWSYRKCIYPPGYSTLANHLCSNFLVPQKIGAHQLVTWSLIFFAANAKPPEDQLGDFADK